MIFPGNSSRSSRFAPSAYNITSPACVFSSVSGGFFSAFAFSGPFLFVVLCVSAVAVSAVLAFVVGVVVVVLAIL